MKLGINGLLVWVKNHYDRVLAFVALAGFVVTLLLLVLQFGAIRKSNHEFERAMRALRPEREHVEPVTDASFQLTMHAIANPLQLETGEARARWFFVPESRFSCAQCGQPVPVAAENCPFCLEPVTAPEEISVDHDGDGIPTWWELQHGLDPNDPADALQDWDGDGFTNLEEFLYDTDPTDPKSHPPLLDWLIVDRVEGERFGLQFRNRVRTRTDYRFGISYRLPNGDTRTDFVEIGGEIEGFAIESYEEKSVPATPPTPGTVDRSELTIRSPRGDRIVLVKDQPILHVEQTAHLRMGRAAPEHQFSVRVDETFTLGGVEHRVIEIDASTRNVIVEHIPQGTRYTVTPVIRPAEAVRQMDPEPDDTVDSLGVEAETTEEPDLFLEMMR